MNDVKIIIMMFEFLLYLVLIIDNKINEMINSNQMFISNIEYISKLECFTVLTIPNKDIQFGQSVTGE